jgi:hypothetical protein
VEDYPLCLGVQRQYLHELFRLLEGKCQANQVPGEDNHKPILLSPVNRVPEWMRQEKHTELLMLIQIVVETSPSGPSSKNGIIKIRANIAASFGSRVRPRIFGPSVARMVSWRIWITALLFLVLCQEFWILECAAEILSLEPAISTILFFKWGLWVLKMTSRVVVLTISSEIIWFELLDERIILFLDRILRVEFNIFCTTGVSRSSQIMDESRMWTTLFCKIYALSSRQTTAYANCTTLLLGRTAAHFVEGLGPDDPLDIPHTLIPMLNLATEEFDVSAVTLDRRTGNHVLTVREKFQPGVHSTAGGGRQSINSTSALFEPLSYPVLFPYGEPGWSMENRIGARGDAFKISFPNYLASRMLMPERYPNGNGAGDGDNYHGKMCIDKYGEEYFMPTNRFERFCRVGQTYLVDQMSRAIDQRLEYREKIKKSIFGEDTRERVIDDRSDDGHSDDEPDEVVAQAFGLNVAGAAAAAAGDGLGTFFDHGADEVVRTSAFPPDFFLPPDPAAAPAAAPPLAPGRRPLDPKSKPTFLGDNFHGSPRHLKKLAINGLHLVTEHQNSHIFLTATVNKKWPELTEVICDDMDPFDVPAIVGIVFQARLQALLHNLKNGK